MQHVEPDDLALAALGEPVLDDDQRLHVDTCPVCAAEVRTFGAAAAAGRSVTPADAVVPPPPQVWERVRDELGLSADLRPDGSLPGGERRAAEHADAVAPHAARPGRVAGPARDGDDDGATVVPMRRRGGSRAPWIATAAAAGVVLGAAGGVWWGGRSDDVTPALLAEAALDPLPGWEATGQAVVEELPDGTRELRLTVEGGEGGEGFREVWLIDRDVTKLVSLGVLEGSEGTFVVPADVDLGDFPVVDVSEEPVDGDPTHSGDSIVRGILDV